MTPAGWLATLPSVWPGKRQPRWCWKLGLPWQPKQHQQGVSFPLSWDFPGGPVVKTTCSQCRGLRFDPCSGKWIPCATARTWHSEKTQTRLPMVLIPQEDTKSRAQMTENKSGGSPSHGMPTLIKPPSSFPAFVHTQKEVEMENLMCLQNQGGR